jgi:hypothetical protein
MVMTRTALRALGFALVVALIASCGCSPSSGSPAATVAEGIIFFVEYQMEGGGTGGFTRVNDAKAVPGGNGSWNVDAHGKLTREFLLITRPQSRDLGPEVIPVHRLVRVQFGDGGIKHVKENPSAPPN